MLMKTLPLLLLVFLTSTGFSKTENNKKIFSGNYIKKTMKNVTVWQLQNPKHEPTDWTNGALFAGVTAAWETTKSKSIYHSIVEMGEKNGWKTGETLVSCR